MAMDIDVVVVGAGILGLAIARELSRSGYSALILEGAGAIGTGTSSRNSEVIHAGLYYPQASLKARFCVEGRKLLYAFCESHGVPFQRCGKLIVATNPAEVGAIEDLQRRGKANGCEDLRLLSRHETLVLEPELECVAALHSPSTGIIDSHSYMLALLGDAEDAGTSLALNTPLLSATVIHGGFRINAGGAEPMELTCRMLINAAGLHASHVAASIEGLSPDAFPRTGYAKGNYFLLNGRAPFQHLIYPAPQTHGLGVHLTLDLGGQARFGPDVEWVDRIDYRVDPARMAGFEDAVRRYWPAMPKDALVPGYSGIRPKISGPSDPAADFRIDGPQEHGIQGLVNLFGIESPGLTSSLALARYVAGLL
ncbi:NAD(P)/FAD-dependent oxidoreductase [Rhizobium helianthi]|uniref:NAD(P)/FAD-dependent oxidoreductase n=1 Tax=Rhizobium helianthi TaxID=1132695 RepID=A0ABW4M6J5_9HYPH